MLRKERAVYMKPSQADAAWLVTINIAGVGTARIQQHQESQEVTNKVFVQASKPDDHFIVAAEYRTLFKLNLNSVPVGGLGRHANKL